MAKADGSIIIDTRIDTKGIQAGVVDTNKQIDRLAVRAKGLAATIGSAMNSSTAATAKLKAEAQLLEERISNLKQKAEAYGKTKIPTKEYQELNANIEKVNAQLNKLEERRARMKGTGISTESQAWKNVEYDISAARTQLSQYMQQKAQMNSTGTAYTTGATTNEYAVLQNELAAANTRLTEVKSNLSTSGSFMSRLGAGAKTFLSAIGNAAKTIGGTMLSGIRSVISGIGSLVKRATAMKAPFNGLGASLKRIAPAMLATEGIMGILRKAVNAFLMQNQQLYNQLRGTWANLGSILSPIITKLINLFSTAVAYVMQFFQLLGITGSAASNAINSAGGSAAKETKKLQKTLASFDEITTLGSKEQDSSGGGGGTSSAGATTPEVTMPDWAQIMIDKLKAGNWAGAASVITEQLNIAIASVDWQGIGAKIGSYINGVFVFLATAIGDFDFASLGEAIAESLMGLWNAIDWGVAGKGLSDGVIGVITTISAAIKKIDWKKIGKDVAKFIKNIDWNDVTTALFDGIGAAIGGLAAFIWGLVEDAWSSVVEWWYEVAFEDGEFTMEGLLEGIWNAIKNIGKWIREKIFDPFIKGFKDAFGIHSPSTVMAEIGGYIIEGLLNGITRAWNSIKTFVSNSVTNVKNSILNAWDTIKNSQTWQTISNNLKSTWDSIKNTASTKFTETKNKVLDAWNAVKNSQTWSNIKSSLTTTWDGIKNTASTKFTDTKNRILEAWNAVKNSNTWNTIKTNLYSAWDDIKSKAESKFGNIRDTISSAWKNAMGSLSGGNVDFSVIGTNIKDAFASGINKLIAGLNDALYRIIYRINDVILDARAIHYEILGKTHYPFYNIPTIPQFAIPYLAKGAVIPPNAPFMAMLGDQKHGTNIEAPLSTIQEAVALVLEDMTGGLMAGFEATVAVLREILEAILGIEIGDTVIAEAVERYNRKMAVVKGG